MVRVAARVDDEGREADEGRVVEGLLLCVVAEVRVAPDARVAAVPV